MSTKNFLFLFFICFFGISQGVSVEELELQLAKKQEQLVLLGKKVRDQIEIINFLNKTILEICPDILAKKKEQLAAAASMFSWISQSNAGQACIEENRQFMKAFFDVKNKKEKYIVSNTFFGYKEGFNESAAIFKFCGASSYRESALFQKLLIQWETLCDEVLMIENELEQARLKLSIKGNV